MVFLANLPAFELDFSFFDFSNNSLAPEKSKDSSILIFASK